MRYSFRLAELIGHVPDPRRRPGTIKSIVEHTGLDRHQVASLLKNEMKYIPLSAISRLCDYLIEHGHAAADELPEALFAVEAEHFWELLARRRRLEVCLGVRRPEDKDGVDGAILSASDSVLQGALLNGVSTLGGLPSPAPFHSGAQKTPSAAAYSGERFFAENEKADPNQKGTPHPARMRQSLVWSPTEPLEEDVLPRARQVYEDFATTSRDKALVCLGSTKSNPVAELVFAQAFGCEPFQSPEDVTTACERNCPLFMRYRDHDPQPPSCWGGRKLSQTEPASQAGFYYETPSGKWECCPWTPDDHDAAIVMYLHRESLGRLEMVLGGFSGRGTRLLARTLLNRAEEFWPPMFEGQGVQVGVCVVQYEIDPQDDRSHDILRTDFTPITQVIPLSREVLQRRFDPQHAQGAPAKPR